MFLEPVFERFVAESPVSVLVRGTLEYALPTAAVDELFAQTATEQYPARLLFSTVVELLGSVVCRVRPSVHAAYQALAHRLPVGVDAVYDKLAGTEPAVAAALVRETARRVTPLVDALGRPAPACLPGYPVRVLDGNYLGRTEHRLRELRGSRAAALPGMSVVVLDPDRQVACAIFPCEDGHAQERRLLTAVLETVAAGEVWIGDRNFCTAPFLSGLRARQAFFLVRQHGALAWEEVTPLVPQGRGDGGALEEQDVRLLGVAGTPVVRRVVVRLDRPTQDGDTELAVLTNLPAAAVPAAAVAAAYRQRWRIEGLFQNLTQALACEVDTLAYPRAALLGFALALVAHNILAVVLAALRAAHGAEAAAGLSYYYLAEEIAGTHRGLMIAIPEPHWQVFRDPPVPALAALLRDVAARVRLRAFQKHPRGPKKKPPPRPPCGRIKHVATAKLLAARKTGTPGKANG